MQKISRIIAHSPYFLLFQKFTNAQFIIELFYFFDRNNIHAPNQFGFRKSYSKNHAILNLITKCYDNIQNKLFSNLILLDVKKAFDSVSHDILVAQLHHCSIRGIANDLFASYLANRQQYTIINNCSSNLERVIFGVPQESILGL